MGGYVAPFHNHRMRRGYAALALLALIWGASFLFIKLAVQDMSPATLVLGRALFGAVTLGVILAAPADALSLGDASTSFALRRDGRLRECAALVWDQLR